MPKLSFYLFLALLIFSCKKLNAQQSQAENLLIRYTFDEGFTGIQHHYILAISKELAQKHELADFAKILVLPKDEIKKIVQGFEGNSFKDIRTERQLVADRGGVLLEIFYLKTNMRIIKSDSGESFVSKEDKEKFGKCKKIVESYLNQ